MLVCIMVCCGAYAIDPIAGPSSVCEGSSITLTDATPGGMWSTSSAATGTISTSGVLTGIAAGVVTVTYTVGGPYVTMDVTVNPTGTLVSTLSPPAICDSTWFDYTPTLSVPGATASWSRAFVTNISALPAGGTGSVHEVLNNTASFPVAVAYVFTVTTGPCISISTVTVNVNPTPRLTNPLPSNTIRSCQQQQAHHYPLWPLAIPHCTIPFHDTQR